MDESTKEIYYKVTEEIVYFEEMLNNSPNNINGVFTSFKY